MSEEKRPELTSRAVGQVRASVVGQDHKCGERDRVPVNQVFVQPLMTPWSKCSEGTCTRFCRCGHQRREKLFWKKLERPGGVPVAA